MDAKISPIKVTFNHFLILTKENKVGILILMIITFLLTHYIFEPSAAYFEEKFTPKPLINANVVIFQSVNLTECCSHQSNSSLAYFLGKSISSIMVLNFDQKKAEEIQKHGMITLPISPICPKCISYVFYIKNLGNEKAQKVILDIKTSSTPKVLGDNPKMVKKECGGDYTSQGCYLIFENIEKDEVITFEIFMEKSSEFVLKSCLVNEKYPCEVQFINIRAESYNSIMYNLSMTMNGRNLTVPTLTNRNYKPNTYYFLDPDSLTKPEIEWIPLYPENYAVCGLT